MAEEDAPRRAMKPPRRSRFGRFVHLLARRYQNYQAAILRAARRRRGRAVDIDVQKSGEGTPWGLHWPTVGRNKLHDPLGRISKKARIDELTDKQIERLRGPRGQKPDRLVTLLEFASDRNVRVEAEVKTSIAEEVLRALLNRPKIVKMREKGLLQFKTLAFMGAPNGPVNRLRPIHDAGGVTILSFTGFSRRKKPISKKAAWPVTDYVRGRARWAA